MQGWGLQALASSTTPSQIPSSGWHALLRTWTPPPHSLLHSDQRAQPDQPSAIRQDIFSLFGKLRNWSLRRILLIKAHGPAHLLCFHTLSSSSTSCNKSLTKFDCHLVDDIMNYNLPHCCFPVIHLYTVGTRFWRLVWHLARENKMHHEFSRGVNKSKQYWHYS